MYRDRESGREFPNESENDLGGELRWRRAKVLE